MLFILLLTFYTGHAQNLDSDATKMENLPNHFFASIQKKYSTIEANLTRKTVSYLQKMQQQEKKLQRKMRKKDPSHYSGGNVDSLYASFNTRLSAEKGSGKVNLNEYNGYIDTLGTSLNFLKRYKGMEDKLKLPSETLNKLKSKFNETEKVKEFIAQRKQQISETLSKYTSLPASLRNEYSKISKTAYYYSAQVKEYRDMLKDPAKIERAAIGLLNRVPAFQSFLQKNSQLASLFGLPGNYGTAASLSGLQTRADVQGMIQQRISAGGPNAMAQVQQNLQEAQSQLTQLKDKLLKGGIPGSGGEIEMPDFKPNSQKTKSFLNRLEYGFNIQFSKNNSLLPSTSDLALTLGYKVNDKSTVGIGMSYKLGLGSIQHISLTSNGVGLRSFMDWKIKRQIFITGGYEINYNSAFKNIDQLKDYNAWQRSALIGLSRKYKISKKVKGNMQLLYDFLARNHVPLSQPVVFRVGYNF